MRTIRFDTHEITPEEILLDARNLPSFNAGTLEGLINKPIGARALLPLILLLIAVGGITIGRAGQIMALDGAYYAELSEQNRIGRARVPAERGIVFDRNDVELAWNIPYVREGVQETYHERAYTPTKGVAHILGYIRMPARDTHGVLYREGVEGVAGAELTYDAYLRGKDGVRLVETDARMDQVSESVLEHPYAGTPLRLTIDTRLQEALYTRIAEHAERTPFRGGAGVIMDVTTGEVLALTSYPEYDPNALVLGDADAIAGYHADEKTPYLNRIVSGQYTPGSIVKPFLAAGALNEGIVLPETSFLSTGALRLPNAYNPELYSVFADWRAHGMVDVRRALAVSSNVYFYYIGGGFGSQEGLGITRIEEYMQRFGFGMATGFSLSGERSGTIPSPKWKAEMFPDDPIWRIGDTYHTSIGQYGFQVTPLQMVRAIGAIANGGLLLTPRIETSYTQYGTRSVDISDTHLKVVREGMRLAVEEGTARSLSVPYVAIAGKTGTAEIDERKQFVHSWVVGFYPYEKPKYAFVVLMEQGPRSNLVGAPYVMRQMLDWMHEHTPEYIDTEGDTP